MMKMFDWIDVARDFLAGRLRGQYAKELAADAQLRKLATDAEAAVAALSEYVERRYGKDYIRCSSDKPSTTPLLTMAKCA